MAAKHARPRFPRLRVALVSVVLTALVGLIVLNLASSEKRLKNAISFPFGTRDAEFRREMGTLFGPALVEGNRVTELENGQAIFPAMLNAIRKAQRSINFETYIYWSGRIGTAFAEALATRARAGVATHLILDAVGSGKIDKQSLSMMRAAGVEIELYHSLRWYQLDRINNRTHRKLLVVDGQIGFTGGVGIADKWDGDASDPNHWRDSHFQLEGPAVAEMQAAFVDHWLASHGVLLDGPAYFPAIAAVGSMAAQVVRSSVDDSAESIHLMYLVSIAAARHSVWLANSYFVPDDLAIDALVAARRRGVDVQIIVPGAHIDTQITRSASRSRWGRLLAAGIPIYEFQPTMFHCKVLVVDGIWTSVGSTNFDNRSFRLNDEANLNVFDSNLAQQEAAAFMRDRARSRLVTLAAWSQRSRWERTKEWFADLVGAEL